MQGKSDKTRWRSNIDISINKFINPSKLLYAPASVVESQMDLLTESLSQLNEATQDVDGFAYNERILRLMPGIEFKIEDFPKEAAAYIRTLQESTQTALGTIGEIAVNIEKIVACWRKEQEQKPLEEELKEEAEQAPVSSAESPSRNVYRLPLSDHPGMEVVIGELGEKGVHRVR